MNLPHILQADDGTAHVYAYQAGPHGAFVQLEAKESSPSSAEASLSLSVHGARAVAAMLLDAADQAENAQ